MYADNTPKYTDGFRPFSRTRTKDWYRNVMYKGRFLNFSIGTERGRVFFLNEVRVREVDGLFSKVWCRKGTDTAEFQQLSTVTGFSTEVVRNTYIITFYIN